MAGVLRKRIGPLEVAHMETMKGINLAIMHEPHAYLYTIPECMEYDE